MATCHLDRIAQSASTTCFSILFEEPINYTRGQTNLDFFFFNPFSERLITVLDVSIIETEVV